jgi:hypothetical protein
VEAAWFDLSPGSVAALDKSQNSERASGEARGRGGLAMTNRDRAELQVATVIGAVLGAQVLLNFFDART